MVEVAVAATVRVGRAEKADANAVDVAAVADTVPGASASG
jgi:hypothetical protein